MNERFDPRKKDATAVHEMTEMPASMRVVYDYLFRATENQLTEGELVNGGIVIEAHLRTQLGLIADVPDGRLFEERLLDGKKLEHATPLEQLQLQVIHYGMLWFIQSRSECTPQQQILADIFVRLAEHEYEREVIDLHAMSPMVLHMFDSDTSVLSSDKKQRLLASKAAEDVRRKEREEIHAISEAEPVVTSAQFVEYLVAECINEGRNPIHTYERAKSLLSPDYESGKSFFFTWYLLRNLFINNPRALQVINTIGFFMLYGRDSGETHEGFDVFEEEDMLIPEAQQVVHAMAESLMNNKGFIASAGKDIATKYFTQTPTPKGGIKWLVGNAIWMFDHKITKKHGQNHHLFLLSKFVPHKDTQEGTYTFMIVDTSKEGGIMLDFEQADIVQDKPQHLTRDHIIHETNESAVDYMLAFIEEEL